MEYVLWGRKAGEDEWCEELITSTTDVQHLAKAKQWAIANGYTVLRVSTLAGEKPDFVAAINT